MICPDTAHHHHLPSSYRTFSIGRITTGRSPVVSDISVPFPLTDKEFEAISVNQDIQAMWGAADEKDMQALLKKEIYAARFDFHSGGPGYVGDMFILAGDALGEPVTLIRNSHGHLSIVEASRF